MKETEQPVEGMYDDVECGLIDPQYIINNFGKSKK